MGGIDDGGVQHLAGLIHNGNLAAGAVAGVQTDGNLALDGGRHQQLAQVDAKQLDGVFAGFFGELGADLTLDGRINQTGIGIFTGLLHQHRAGVAALHVQRADDIQRTAGVGLQIHLQKALFFASVEGQYPVTLQLVHRLGEVIVGGVNAVFGLFVLLDPDGLDAAVDAHQIAYPLAHLGIVGDLFRDDVLGTLQGGLGILYALFGVDKGLCQFQGGFAQFLIEQQCLCQRFQTLFPCHAGAGLALGAEGTVNVVDLGKGGCLVQCGRYLFRQIALRLDELADFLAAGVQIAEILQLVGNLTDQLVIHGAVHFLAVTGDEGDGISLVQQGDDIGNIVLTDVEFFCNDNCVRHDLLLSGGSFTIIPQKKGKSTRMGAFSAVC